MTNSSPFKKFVYKSAMKQRYNREKRIMMPNVQGLAYDLTISFNAIKEQKAASAFKKPRKNIDNILNVHEEPLIIQKTYEIEDKIEQLHKISNFSSFFFV